MSICIQLDSVSLAGQRDRHLYAQGQDGTRRKATNIEAADRTDHLRGFACGEDSNSRSTSSSSSRNRLLTMLKLAPARVASRIKSQSISISIPLFLAPAFQTFPHRTFSSSLQRSSKIGAEPLAIPPGITFTVLPPIQDVKNLRKAPTASVNIKGPLGRWSGTTDSLQELIRTQAR